MVVNRHRYEGYVAIKSALSDEAPDEHAAGVLRDVAEALLLARDSLEAEAARERVPGTLVLLVDGGYLSRPAAHRFWARVKACGPDMRWPPTWQRDAPARLRRVR
jgi:hypothetical protein